MSKAKAVARSMSTVRVLKATKVLAEATVTLTKTVFLRNQATESQFRMSKKIKGDTKNFEEYYFDCTT